MYRTLGRMDPDPYFGQAQGPAPTQIGMQIVRGLATEAI